MNNPEPILGVTQIPRKAPLEPVCAILWVGQQEGGKFSTMIAYPASSQSGSWGFMPIRRSIPKEGHCFGCSLEGSQRVHFTNSVEEFVNISVQTEWDYPVVILPLLHWWNWGYCSLRSLVRVQVLNLWARCQLHHNMDKGVHQDLPWNLSISPYVNGWSHNQLSVWGLWLLIRVKWIEDFPCSNPINGVCLIVTSSLGVVNRHGFMVS